MVTATDRRDWRKKAVSRFREIFAVKQNGPPETASAFWVLIGFRFVTVVLAVSFYVFGLVPSALDGGAFWRATALVVVYNSALALFSRGMFRLVQQRPYLVLFDFALSFVVLSTTIGWGSPFWMYTLTTCMTPFFLRSLMVSSAGAALWSVLYSVALVQNGYTLSVLADIEELDTFFAFHVDYQAVALIYSYLYKLLYALRGTANELEKSEAHARHVADELSLVDDILLDFVAVTRLDELGTTLLQALDRLGAPQSTVVLRDDGDGRWRWYGARETLRAVFPDDSGFERFLEGVSGIVGWIGHGKEQIYPLWIGERCAGAVILSGRASGDAPSSDALEAVFNGVKLKWHKLGVIEKWLERQVDEERQRIAEDLHDNILQNLYGAQSLMESMNANCASSACDDLAIAIDAIRTSIKDLRFSVYNISAGDRMEDQGFLAYIERHLSDLSEKTDLSCTLHAEVDEATMPSHIQRFLLRSMREGLANALRHSGARTCDVYLTTTGDEVVMQVVDDGVGIEGDIQHRTGVGLRSIVRRCDELGGNCSIGPRTDEGGTALEVRLPLEGNDR